MLPGHGVMAHAERPGRLPWPIVRSGFAPRPLLFLILLVIAFVLFGVGFTLHALWWIAVVLGIVAIVGFVTGRRGGGD